MRTLTPPRPPGPVTPRIDPRIRERRIAVTRHQGRRRLRLLVGVITAAVATALAVLVFHLSWFRVSHIAVRGAVRTGGPLVAAAARPALHQPLISVDTGAVVRRVERLPWVASARVTKSWPSTLDVTVVERTAVAQVASGARWAEVDGTGRVLNVGPAPAPRLMVLAWSGALPAPGRYLSARARTPLAVAARLQPLAAAGPGVPAPVVSVGIGAGGGVAVDLADGAVVDLGPPVDVSAKLTALATLEAEVDLSGVKAVDLRVPDQPVLTRG